jgi:hypothetical protein
VWQPRSRDLAIDSFKEQCGNVLSVLGSTERQAAARVERATIKSMLDWLVIAAMVLVANVLLAVAMNGAGRALQDWGAAYSRRRLLRESSASAN